MRVTVEQHDLTLILPMNRRSLAAFSRGAGQQNLQEDTMFPLSSQRKKSRNERSKVTRIRQQPQKRLLPWKD